MTTLDSFLQNVRDTLRRNHLSLRAEEAYLHRIKQYIHFHDRVFQLLRVGEKSI